MTRRLSVAALLVLGSACKRLPDPTPQIAKPEPLPTYANRVRASLEAHCTTCHAAGGIAPFSLASFEAAHEHAADIARVTADKHMPPWLPDEASCAPLQFPRALPPAEIAMFGKWAETGAPAGDPKDYAKPALAKTYAPVKGPPSAVAQADEPYTPKTGRADDYHCFVLEPAVDRSQRITALRIQPGIPALVHHVLLYEVRKNAVASVLAQDAKEPGAGYTCFGGIGVQPSIRQGDLKNGELVDFDAQLSVAWAPGGGATDVAGGATALPAGTAISLKPGSRIVMQVHYSLENYAAGMLDQTKVEMWFAPREDLLKQAVWIPLLKYDFRVPANEVGTARAEIELPLPLEILGVAPHMHLRGQSIRVESLERGKSPACVMDIPRWDFHHQEAYWLKEPIRTSKASVSCTWDNRGPKSKQLRWGEGTNDEMCLAFLYATL